MGVVYFRRFRMEIDLRDGLSQQPPLSADYRLTPWDDRLLEAHAEVKYRCFRWELDANVFPSLATRSGCQRLMVDIATTAATAETKQ